MSRDRPRTSATPTGLVFPLSFAVDKSETYRLAFSFRATLPKSRPLASSIEDKPFSFVGLCWSPACLLPQLRTSIFLSRDSVGVPSDCFLGRGQVFFFRATLPESRLLASSVEDKPFSFAWLYRSAVCLLPRSRTSLFLLRDFALGGWSPACLLPRARTSYLSRDFVGSSLFCFPCTGRTRTFFPFVGMAVLTAQMTPVKLSGVLSRCQERSSRRMIPGASFSLPLVSHSHHSSRAGSPNCLDDIH